MSIEHTYKQAIMNHKSVGMIDTQGLKEIFNPKTTAGKVVLQRVHLFTI